MARLIAVVFVVAAFAILGTQASSASSKSTPIEKVLDMMNDLMLKSVAEKKAEVETFEKFKTWCHETTRDKGMDIEDGAKAIEALGAELEKHNSDAEALATEVAQLDEELAVANSQFTKATNKRKSDEAAYRKTHADYVQGLEAMKSSIADMKKTMAASGGAALLQTPELPAFAQKALASFLATSDEDEALGTPEAAGFASSSGDKVKNMEKLEDMLKNEKNDLEKSELRSQNAFNMLMNDLNHRIKTRKAAHADRSSAMKQAEGAAAQAKGDMAEATRVKDEDEKYVRDLDAMCKQKASDFEIRQTTRGEEIEAINNAMEIIGSGDVAGAGSKHLPGLVQRKAKSLAQLRSSGRQPSSSQAEVASFLASQAATSGSRQLSMLAAHVSADPFVKVRNMIEAMITKLQEEASDEADEKGWCDEELSTNEQTREAKTTRTAELKASVEEMTAAAQKLANDIASLETQVVELDSSVAEATKTRQEEKSKNAETIADAKVAIEAVQRAMKVLKDFYKKSAGATALVQVAQRGPADDAPETFDAAFTGNSGGNGSGGILSMMDVILSDFQRLFADTEEAEALGSHEFKSFSAESTADRESKEEDRVSKASRMSKTKHDIRMANKDLKSTEGELAKADEYFGELKPKCVESGVSFEERVKARNAEIASLQEALQMLLEGTPE